jgi:hypothetical protein
MSAAEVIRDIQKLTPAEQSKVQAYLMHEHRARDPRWQDELARRIEEARSGHALTASEVRALVTQLKTGS